MAKNFVTTKTIKSLTHEDATRKNIPTAEYQSVLKAEINEDAWAKLNSDTSCPFFKPPSCCITVKVINHLVDEVMTVFKKY